MIVLKEKQFKYFILILFTVIGVLGLACANISPLMRNIGMISMMCSYGYGDYLYLKNTNKKQKKFMIVSASLVFIISCIMSKYIIVLGYFSAYIVIFFTAQLSIIRIKDTITFMKSNFRSSLVIVGTSIILAIIGIAFINKIINLEFMEINAIFFIVIFFEAEKALRTYLIKNKKVINNSTL